MSAKQPSGGEPFATTHWSMVLAAGRRDSPAADEALATLCATYWYPLYAYVRRRVPDAHQAQDMTQEFFATLLEKNFLAGVRPERGRFRAFLLTALRNFLSKEWERAKAQKRGGGRRPLSIDFGRGETRYAVEPSGGLTAEQLYDRAWAVSVLDSVLGTLQAAMHAEGKAESFERLKGFLVGDHSGATYAETAEATGASEAAVKMAVHRLRQRYRRLLRAEIAQTVDSPEDVDDEIRGLLEALGTG